MPKLTRPIVFLDVESTGVDPVLDRIIELGMVLFKPDGEYVEWNRRFNPGFPIPAAATEVHGISDADVADCPPFEKLAGQIHKAISGKDLGGYNLRSLDLPMLDEEFRRADLKLELDGIRIIDCFRIFSKKEPRKLEDAVRKYCGREHDGAHGALADAKATLDVFIGQIGMYEDLRGMELDALAEFCLNGDQRPADIAGKLYYDKENRLCYGFGKWKDRPVSDDPSYAEWMLSKNFPGSTCEVLRAELNRIYGVAEC